MVWERGLDCVNEQRIKPPYRPKVLFPGDRTNFDDYDVRDGAGERISAMDDALFVDF